jgi:2-polyprenyl-3-methyl-5-hydroxy-6-metoxy-1,4-benzoquinol methylase
MPEQLSRLTVTPPEVPGTRRPYILWADRYDVPVRRLACPNCGDGAAKQQRLTIRYTIPEQPMRFARVLHCAACDCDFYERQQPPDYAEEANLKRGRAAFYLQQGAGIAALTAPLMRTGRGAGTRYLDVGCGFGFALDFARAALGWEALGIDPSPMAVLGREMLGAAIEHRYLGDDEPEYATSFDVVMAAETIEHVPSPIASLHTLRKVMRPGAMLILTTPDAEDINPATAPGAVVALLSAGFHLILQSRASLEALLHRAGFAHVTIEKDGYSLVAYASDRRFVLDTNRDRFRADYLGYLTSRAQDFPLAHDLRLGFAGRALQEATNAGDLVEARRCYDDVREICIARYGIDLETIEALPAETRDASLERLYEIMPLSLGGLLYADTIRRFGESAARPPFERRLQCAAEAADTLRRACAELTMEDALSEQIAWVARTEAILCAAVAGSADAVERALRMPPFPGNDEKRIQRVRERTLIALVNTGNIASGRTLARQSGLQQAVWADPAELNALDRDTLFCLAIIEMQDEDLDEIAGAMRRFALVRRQIATAGLDAANRDLCWAALRGEVQALTRLGLADRIEPLLARVRTEAAEPPDAIVQEAAAAEGAPVQDHLVAQVNAGRYTEARMLAAYLEEGGLVDPPPAALREHGRDRLFALAILDAQPGGNTERAARRFAAVRASLLRSRGEGVENPDLYRAALHGEVEARIVLSGEAAGERLRQQAEREIAA